MTQFVHDDVERARDDPDPGAELRLALVLGSATPDTVHTHVSSLDEVTVERTMDSDMVIVSTPETSVDALCALSGVSSISPSDSMSTC